jgi:hypothetical protein
MDSDELEDVVEGQYNELENIKNALRSKIIKETQNQTITKTNESITSMTRKPTIAVEPVK